MTNCKIENDNELVRIDWDALANIHKEDISTCPYSVAMVSLVKSPIQEKCIRWLLENRNSDGTWGVKASVSWYDAYISTYAAMVAFENCGLANMAREIPVLLIKIRMYEKRDLLETMTFGGLISTLDCYRANNNMILVNHGEIINSIIDEENGKWDRLSRWEYFLNSDMSVAGHTGERIYNDTSIDIDKFIGAFQVENCSISNTPGASAMVYLEAIRRNCDLEKRELQSLKEYLFSLDPYIRSVGYLDFFPHFVTAWALMFIEELGFPYKKLNINSQRLQVNEIDEQITTLHLSRLLCVIGETSTIPGDADSTSCSFIACRYANHQINNPDIFNHMFDTINGYYKTFFFERNPAISTNIHAAAYLYKYEQSSPNLLRVIDWLAREIQTPETFICKWHISPLYTFGEAARVFSRMHFEKAQDIARAAVNRILQMQHSDGSWGVDGYTAEETGYAAVGLTAMLQYILDNSKKASSVPKDLKELMYAAILRAEEPLQNRPVECVPLWIGKSLYCVLPLVPILHQVAIERIKQIKLNYADKLSLCNCR
jgi:hypothetical protein